MAACQVGSCLQGRQGGRVPMYVHTCACERIKCMVNTSCGKNYSGTFPLLQPSEFITRTMIECPKLSAIEMCTYFTSKVRTPLHSALQMHVLAPNEYTV